MSEMGDKSVKVRPVESGDREFWMSIDKHVDDGGFQNRVYTKTGYVIWEDNTPVGLLHYCLLWDNLPFLNLIYIKEAYRKKRYGTLAMDQWEAEMKRRGFGMTLISTQVDEEAQFFYRKRGYIDCGGLVLHGTPFDQPMEMFMRKVL